MEICAKEVREISCARCLDYEKCVRNGHTPNSRLAQYLAWLSLIALRKIEAELQQYCVSGIKLEAHAPNDVELAKGAYAVVRVYHETNKRLCCRVLLVDEIYDEEYLRAAIFNAYFRNKGKINATITKA